MWVPRVIVLHCINIIVINRYLPKNFFDGAMALHPPLPTLNCSHVLSIRCAAMGMPRVCTQRHQQRNIPCSTLKQRGSNWIINFTFPAWLSTDIWLQFMILIVCSPGILRIVKWRESDKTYFALFGWQLEHWLNPASFPRDHLRKANMHDKGDPDLSPSGSSQI